MRSILISMIVFSSLLMLADAQSNPHYMMTDPAISEMLISMDMPRYTGNVPAEIMAGDWQFNLSDGENIELTLFQSGAAVFGKGTVANRTLFQEAFSSGSVSGNSLNLDIVPESGTQLYAISVDISSLPFEGTYVIFMVDSALQTGTMRASKNST